MQTYFKNQFNNKHNTCNPPNQFRDLSPCINCFFESYAAESKVKLGYIIVRSKA